jgi:hypothetical protein
VDAIIISVLYVVMLGVFFAGGVVMLCGITYTKDTTSAIGVGIMIAAIAMINIMFTYLR